MKTVTVPGGVSAPESAVLLLRDCIRALQNHPRDAAGVTAATKAHAFLARFPTHFVTEYLVKEGDQVRLARVSLDAWPDWAIDAKVDRGQLPAIDAPTAPGFDFEAHLARQAAWSEQTFGPGSRAQGVVDHIRKELEEIEADPGDLKEWVDVVILALDGAWRAGFTPQEIIDALVAKQSKNEGRTWPDWRTVDPSKAIEHDRTGEGARTVRMDLSMFDVAGDARSNLIARGWTPPNEVETCEGADPNCGPVEFHDGEGIPLCRRCWDSLADDTRDGAA